MDFCEVKEEEIMTKIETLRIKIENLCWQYWQQTPEPKKSYSTWWYETNGVKEALDRVKDSA